MRASLSQPLPLVRPPDRPLLTAKRPNSFFLTLIHFLFFLEVEMASQPARERPGADNSGPGRTWDGLGCLDLGLGRRVIRSTPRGGLESRLGFSVALVSVRAYRQPGDLGRFFRILGDGIPGTAAMLPVALPLVSAPHADLGSPSLAILACLNWWRQFKVSPRPSRLCQNRHVSNLTHHDQVRA